jgi:hypothetical protein
MVLPPPNASVPPPPGRFLFPALTGGEILSPCLSGRLAFFLHIRYIYVVWLAEGLIPRPVIG